jgi:hypothetical protein
VNQLYPHFQSHCSLIQLSENKPEEFQGLLFSFSSLMDVLFENDETGWTTNFNSVCEVLNVIPTVTALILWKIKWIFWAKDNYGIEMREQLTLAEQEIMNREFFNTKPKGLCRRKRRSLFMDRRRDAYQKSAVILTRQQPRT